MSQPCRCVTTLSLCHNLVAVSQPCRCVTMSQPYHCRADGVILMIESEGDITNVTKSDITNVTKSASWKALQTQLCN